MTRRSPRALLAAHVQGHRWLVAHDVAVSGTSLAAELLQLGAREVLVIAAARGTGPLQPDVPAYWLELRADGLMDNIRAAERMLSGPLPDWLQARVDAFDPDGSARVLRPFFSAGRPVAGRRVWGARPLAWQALEDKTRIDEVWDAAGVTRVAAQVVAPGDVPAAHEALDVGAGTVQAADNHAGWHGGAAGTRWVRDARDQARALELFSGCDRVRVMPFLEGIPCSIHGIVFEQHVVALRPCEMLVFRNADRRFVYASAATCWDPSQADAEQMRQVARDVGTWLRHTHAYRGVFTVDGVMTAQGFRPTELNPRFGAAILTLSQGLEDLPLLLLHFAWVEGVAGDWQPRALEQRILAHAEAHRRGRLGIVCDVPVTAESVRVVLADGGVREAQAGEPADATVAVGPFSKGSYLNVQLAERFLLPGPALAPRALPLLAWADARWGLGHGELEAARAVR